MIARSLAAVRAAALADAATDPPLSQGQADLVAAILGPAHAKGDAA
jgi:hypothetical protein